jgi:holo-[acyl-carrier protein] synthase
MTPAAVLASVWNASLPSTGSEAATAGAGIDLVNLASFAALHETGGPAFLEIGWTDAEQHDAQGSLERLAARWAAKEAVMKALQCGLGDLDPLDVEILTEPGGAPRVVLHRNALAAASALGVSRWHVSLCHEEGWAAALAVAERSPATSRSTQRNEGNHDA